MRILSNKASIVLKYLKDNRIPIPINVRDIKIDRTLDDISNAIIELETLGYLELTNTLDQEYPIIVSIKGLD